MTLVAMCAAGGSSGTTTTSLLLAASAPPATLPGLLLECDPDGGDVAAWAQLSTQPGWATAAGDSDRSWETLLAHTQALPSGMRFVAAPTRALQAHQAIAASAEFAGLVAGLGDVLAVADCGAVRLEPSSWARVAHLTLLLVRQVGVSAPATVARIDRALEAIEVLRSGCRQVGVVLVGGTPYNAAQVAQSMNVELFGTLPEDSRGAGLVCGGWTMGRGASKSPLARSARDLLRRVVETVYGRGATTSDLHRIADGVPT